MADPEINLGHLAGKGHKYELSLSNESQEDGIARREQDAANAILKRKITWALFCFALFITFMVFSGCVYLFVIGTPDDKKWAASIVSAIASGLVGFLVGQGRK